MPSKLTAVGTYTGIIGLLIAVISMGLNFIDSESANDTSENAYTFYKLSLRGAAISVDNGAEVDGCVVIDNESFREFIVDRVIDGMPFLLEIDVPNCAALECDVDYFSVSKDADICLYMKSPDGMPGAAFFVEGLMGIESNSRYGIKWYDRYHEENVFQEFYQSQTLDCIGGFCTYRLKPYVVDPDRAAATFAELRSSQKQ
ncbi:MAG: hypothetical protein ABW201_07410 [Candidatus Thiodiazotropha sp.]